MRLKPFYMVLAFVIALPQAGWSENDTVAIWSGLAPGSENKENNEKWEGQTEVSKVYQPDLTVFPLKGGKASPALVVFPGGGYRYLEMEKEGYKIARWANKQGMTGFVLKYRLNRDDALRDAQRAISFVRANAKKYNIDKDKIGVIGFSAGAHLAGGLVMNHSWRKKVDKIDDASSRPDFWVGVYGAYGDIYGLLGKYRKIENISPTFLVHASDDPKANVLASVELFADLMEKNVPAELHVYEKGNHGFALEQDWGDEAVASTVNAWPRRLLEWLKVRDVL